MVRVSNLDTLLAYMDSKDYRWATGEKLTEWRPDGEVKVLGIYGDAIIYIPYSQENTVSQEAFMMGKMSIEVEDYGSLMEYLEELGFLWKNGDKPTDARITHKTVHLNYGKLSWSDEDSAEFTQSDFINSPVSIVFNREKQSTTVCDNNGSTTVRLREGDVWSDYSGFCIAYTQHMLGGHKNVLRTLRRAVEHGEPIYRVGDRFGGGTIHGISGKEVSIQTKDGGMCYLYGVKRVADGFKV